MYYEAILYKEPKIKFKINTVPDEVAKGWGGVVSFFGANGSGKKAYGKTREDATNKLRGYITAEIMEHETQIASLKRLLNQIKQ